MPKTLKRRGTDTYGLAQDAYSVWFAHFAERIGAKLATFTFPNLMAIISISIELPWYFPAPFLLFGKGKVSETCTDVKKSARGSASIPGVSRSKFMKCQKFV